MSSKHRTFDDDFFKVDPRTDSSGFEFGRLYQQESVNTTNNKLSFPKFKKSNSLISNTTCSPKNVRAASTPRRQFQFPKYFSSTAALRQSSVPSKPFHVDTSSQEMKDIMERLKDFYTEQQTTVAPLLQRQSTALTALSSSSNSSHDLLNNGFGSPSRLSHHAGLNKGRRRALTETTFERNIRKPLKSTSKRILHYLGVDSLRDQERTLPDLILLTWYVCFEPNVAKVKAMLRPKDLQLNAVTSPLMNVDNEDSYGRGILLLNLACYSNNVDIVKCLLDFGVNPRLRDINGFSSLHFACMIGNKAALVYQLVPYFDLNHRDSVFIPDLESVGQKSVKASRRFSSRPSSWYGDEHHEDFNTSSKKKRKSYRFISKTPSYELQHGFVEHTIIQTCVHFKHVHLIKYFSKLPNIDWNCLRYQYPRLSSADLNEDLVRCLILAGYPMDISFKYILSQLPFLDKRQWYLFFKRYMSEFPISFSRNFHWDILVSNTNTEEDDMALAECYNIQHAAFNNASGSNSGGIGGAGYGILNHSYSAHSMSFFNIPTNVNSSNKKYVVDKDLWIGNSFEFFCDALVYRTSPIKFLNRKTSLYNDNKLIDTLLMYYLQDVELQPRIIYFIVRVVIAMNQAGMRRSPEKIELKLIGTHLIQTLSTLFTVANIKLDENALWTLLNGYVISIHPNQRNIVYPEEICNQWWDKQQVFDSNSVISLGIENKIKALFQIPLVNSALDMLFWKKTNRRLQGSHNNNTVAQNNTSSNTATSSSGEKGNNHKKAANPLDEKDQIKMLSKDGQMSTKRNTKLVGKTERTPSSSSHVSTEDSAASMHSASFSKWPQFDVEAYKYPARHIPAVMFYTEFIMRIITFVIMASVAINDYGNINTEEDMQTSESNGWTRSEIVLVVMFGSEWLHEIGEYLEVDCDLRAYLEDDWNYLDLWNTLIAGLWWIFRMIPSTTYISRVLIPLLAITWSFGLMRFLSMNKELGIMIIIIKEMLRDFMVFVVVYAVVIAGFGIAFRSLFYHSLDFSTNTATFLFLFSGTLSNFDFSTFGTQVTLKERLGIFLTVAFVILTGIMMINLLIALMSNSYQRIRDTSQMEWSYEKARTVKRLLIITESNVLCILPAPLNLVPIFLTGFGYWGASEGSKQMLYYNNFHPTITKYWSTHRFYISHAGTIASRFMSMVTYPCMAYYEMVRWALDLDHILLFLKDQGISTSKFWLIVFFPIILMIIAISAMFYSIVVLSVTMTSIPSELMTKQNSLLDFHLLPFIK